METKRKFNKRAFFSIGMLVSGIGLPLSGLMNHYTGFEPLTVERHFWMSVHDVSGILFAIFALSHIILNRRSIITYIHTIKGRLVNREAIAAIIIVLFITALISSHAFHAG
jgi:hypothetical protein